jgi:hypothetical protein
MEGLLDEPCNVVTKAARKMTENPNKRGGRRERELKTQYGSTQVTCAMVETNPGTDDRFVCIKTTRWS